MTDTLDPERIHGQSLRHAGFDDNGTWMAFVAKDILLAIADEHEALEHMPGEQRAAVEGDMTYGWGRAAVAYRDALKQEGT